MPHWRSVLFRELVPRRWQRTFYFAYAVFGLASVGLFATYFAWMIAQWLSGDLSVKVSDSLDHLRRYTHLFRIPRLLANDAVDVWRPDVAA
jgi:hypothetical protein